MNGDWAKRYAQAALSRKQFALPLASRLIAALLQTGITVLLARQLPLADFGAFASAASIASIVLALANQGSTSLLLRVGLQDDQRVASSALTWSFASTIVSIAATVAVCLSLQLTILYPFLLGLLAALSDSLNLAAQNRLLGKMEWSSAQRNLVLTRLFPFIGVATAAVFAWDVLTAATVGYLGAVLFALVLFCRLKPSVKSLKLALRQAHPYWRVAILSFIQQLDVPLVARFISSAAAGAYAAAFRLASPVHLVTTTMTSLFTPHLASQSSSEQKRRIAKRMLVTGSIYAALVAASSPLAAVIGPMLLGQEYAPYRLLFAIFFINSAFSVVSQVISSISYAFDRAYHVGYLTAGSTAILGLLLFASLLLANPFLAACSLLAAQLFLMLGSLALFRRIIRERS